jgi:3-dehydroquinate synthase
MREIEVHLSERGYPILIEPGLIEKTGSLVHDRFSKTQVVIVSDTTVADLYSKPLAKSLQSQKIESTIYSVADGENSKTLHQADMLYAKLFLSGFRRDGLIIALGGGVVGDLAGFVAATIFRGVPFIQIPTTLLAQVDSSVGGKVGVNHPLGKNLIGSFYQPKLVLIDPLVLDTLPMRERWAGAAEVLKYALIRDDRLFGLLEKSLEDLIALKNLELVSGVLETCCRIKAEIVEKDEKETGLRRILNFGHTIGHALEAATKYEYFRHGEAVAFGMAWAVQFSMEKGFLDNVQYQRADAMLRRFSLPPIPESVSAEVLLKHIRSDKKQTAEGLNLVLLKDIGQSVVVQMDEFGDSLKMLLNRQIIDL